MQACKPLKNNCLSDQDLTNFENLQGGGDANACNLLRQNNLIFKICF